MPEYNETFELKNSGKFNGVYRTKSDRGERFYVYYRDGVYDKDKFIHFSVDTQSNGQRFHISWPIPPDAGVNYKLYYDKGGRKFPSPDHDNLDDLSSSRRSQAQAWASDPQNKSDLPKAAEEFTHKVWT
jgi:hypothetical protein